MTPQTAPPGLPAPAVHQLEFHPAWPRVPLETAAPARAVGTVLQAYGCLGGRGEREREGEWVGGECGPSSTFMDLQIIIPYDSQVQKAPKVDGPNVSDFFPCDFSMCPIMSLLVLCSQVPLGNTGDLEVPTPVRCCSWSWCRSPSTTRRHRRRCSIGALGGSGFGWRAADQRGAGWCSVR